MQAKLMFARFPYGHIEHDDVTDWLIKNVAAAKADPRISEVLMWKKSDTPIDMLRNKAMFDARQLKCDLILMIDSDMRPDLYLGQERDAKPFLKTALDLVLGHQGPCVAAAPYGGPPPHEVPYIAEWTNRLSHNPDADLKLSLMTREQVAFRTGIEEVVALPTGLILIDMRVLNHISPPWFAYEFTDKFCTEKATTEDIYFTRNCSLAGIPQYCLWNCWAGHHKSKCVGKPIPLTCDSVRKEFREAVLRNQSGDKRVLFQDHLDRGEEGDIEKLIRAAG